MQKEMSRFGVLVTACMFSVGLVIFGVVNVGHWLSAPGTAPTQGDVIVALGGSGGTGRVETALQLYREGHANTILLTGFSKISERKLNPYLHWESRFLLDAGVPSDVLLFDDRSRNSYDEANNTAVLMKSRQWKRVLVVSDPPHLRRLGMVWGTACARHGLEYRLIATESPTWNASNWWRDKVWARFVGMELLKLSYYAMAY